MLDDVSKLPVDQDNTRLSDDVILNDARTLKLGQDDVA